MIANPKESATHRRGAWNTRRNFETPRCLAFTQCHTAELEFPSLSLTIIITAVKNAGERHTVHASGKREALRFPFSLANANDYPSFRHPFVSSLGHCRQFLNEWVHRIRALAVGDLAMAPCGWIRLNGEGHVVIFVVMRQEGEFYSVSIVNPCGEGAEYHAHEADPAKGKVGFAT